MFDTCFNCGLYRPDKIIDPDGPFAICPECDYRHAFLMLPLFIVSGASGAGKTTVFHELVGVMTEAVLLDSDNLWREEFNQPETGYKDYFEMWLRLCKNISQSGRPVVLFGAGMGVPANLEERVERRYFSTIHYLALICDDETLVDRLRKRPKWRTSSNQVYINEHVSFNQWFKKNGHKTNPPVTLLNTTNISVQETTARVMAWIYERI